MCDKCDRCGKELGDEDMYSLCLSCYECEILEGYYQDDQLDLSKIEFCDE